MGGRDSRRSHIIESDLTTLHGDVCLSSHNLVECDAEVSGSWIKFKVIDCHGALQRSCGWRVIQVHTSGISENPTQWSTCTVSSWDSPPATFGLLGGHLPPEYPRRQSHPTNEHRYCPQQLDS